MRLFRLGALTLVAVLVLSVSIAASAGEKKRWLVGVTTARDLGAPLQDSLEVRSRIEQGEIPGPRLFISGPFIQHKAYPGTKAFRWGVKGTGDARAKVRRLAETGVDVIKVVDQDEMRWPQQMLRR